VVLAILMCLAYADDVCVLMVPDNPLTPLGLTTPYHLVGAGCNQANILMSRFVHAVILNVDNGNLQLYNPLVISTQNAAVPPVPINFTVNNHVVGIWIGSNSNTLTLGNPAGVANGLCVSGTTPTSNFGQFAFCNVDAFWKAIEKVRAAGNLAVPNIGTAIDGQVCPTIRDYFVVDMDPDDGVQTQYLVTANGDVIQKTANNMQTQNIQGELANDGDHRLVSAFLTGASGCQGWLIPDLADPPTKRAALPMNVLQAVYYQPMPVESLPNTDPMTTTNGQPDLAKLNLYKKGIYQPQINNLVEADPAVFCRRMVDITAPRITSLAANLMNVPSPMMGVNLLDFVKNRASGTYKMLNCLGLINVQDPFPNLTTTMVGDPMKIKVINDTWDWEEYINGGYDDYTVNRKYRFGTYYQEIDDDDK